MPWSWAVPAAASIGGALIGADAAGSAADIQARATGQAVDETRRQYDTTRSDLAPYREAGTAALSRLRSLLNLDSGDTSSSPLLRKFTSADLASDVPYNAGLQFGLDEGRKAIERRAAAPGGTGYDSGATLKALTRFGTDYGTTKAEGAYGRFIGNQGDIYGRLAGVAGMGQGATNVGVGAGMNASSNLASLYSGQGNAAGAARIAQGNAIGGGISGAGNYYGQYNMLQQLMGGGGRALTSDPNLVGASDVGRYTG
jgi:hypothetical protein